MWPIKKILIRSIWVNRRHLTREDTNMILDHLCKRSKTVCSTARIGYNALFSCQNRFIHPIDNRCIHLFSRSWDKHFFDSIIHMCLERRSRSKFPCTFQKDIYIINFPVNFFWFPGTKKMSSFSFYKKTIILCVYRIWKLPMNRIIRKQKGFIL